MAFQMPDSILLVSFQTLLSLEKIWKCGQFNAFVGCLKMTRICQIHNSFLTVGCVSGWQCNGGCWLDIMSFVLEKVHYTKMKDVISREQKTVCKPPFSPCTSHALRTSLAIKEDIVFAEVSAKNATSRIVHIQRTTELVRYSCLNSLKKSYQIVC